MKETLTFLAKWAGMMFWAGISPESAIVAWQKVGISFVFAVSFITFASSLSVMANYGLFSGLFWIFGKIRRRMKTVAPPKERDKKSKLTSWKRGARLFYRIRQRKARSLAKNSIEGNKYLNQHLVLVLLNVVPLPLLTAATIFAAKIKRIKGGIYSILFGNFLKILTVAIFVYRYL